MHVSISHYLLDLSSFICEAFVLKSEAVCTFSMRSLKTPICSSTQESRTIQTQGETNCDSDLFSSETVHRKGQLNIYSSFFEAMYLQFSFFSYQTKPN